MGPEGLVAFEFVMVFGLLLGIGIWELWSLRRYRRQKRETERQAEEGESPE